MAYSNRHDELRARDETHVIGFSGPRQRALAGEGAQKPPCNRPRTEGRFNFMMPGKSPEALAHLERLQITDIPPVGVAHVQEAAILQGFLRLRESFDGCRLSAGFDEHAINIATNYDLPRRRPPGRPFVIAVRADFTPCTWADVEVVHNKAQIAPGRVFIPDFPQLGIIPRTEERGKTFSTVGYMGRAINYSRCRGLVNFGFSVVAGEVERICRALKLRLVAKPMERWHDYSDVDAVLGLRDFYGFRYPSKPSAKMINAWQAGVPFIGGADSAFLDAGEPEWNYLRVRNAADLRSALERLADDPVLRASLVRRGREACGQFGANEVTERWAMLLKETALPLFQAREDGHVEGPASLAGRMRRAACVVSSGEAPSRRRLTSVL